MIRPGIDLLVGLAAAVLFIRLARRHAPGAELRLYAAGLLIAAGVYVAFGLVLGGKPLGYELIQLVVVTIIVVVGIRRSPMIIAGGWLLHSGWDLLHVLPDLSRHAPDWYVFACLSFDVVVAGYIVAGRGGYHLDQAGAPPMTKPVDQT
ncbi:MAG TPA: DUF6010 family protein [Rhodothermales bacterium]|nr:DUF6010 family protein [Rhodothermales bacterium]